MLSYQLAMIGACASSYVLGLSWYLYFAPLIGSNALMSFYWDRAYWVRPLRFPPWATEPLS